MEIGYFFSDEPGYYQVYKLHLKCGTFAEHLFRLIYSRASSASASRPSCEWWRRQACDGRIRTTTGLSTASSP